MVSTVDIPFEIWHPILRDVYSDISVFPHLEDPCYVLSPLHQRLLVHRNISLVSKHLHELSSAVFPEDLHIYHPEALLAVSRLVTKYPNIARVIRKLWFNFYEYRCGASSPRRPRTMKGPLAEVPIPPDADPVAQAEARLRRSLEQRRRVALLRYSPSVTNQPRHWQGWIGLTRTILARCKGVSEVSIDATADYSQHFRRPNARDYRTLFGSPNLDSDALICGLLEASNLQVLRLINPSPLESFGAALSKWPMLHEVEVVVSEAYPEAGRLSEAIFIPPASLRNFTLMNCSHNDFSLPNTSDLSKCTSLSSLQLGVLDLSDTVTVLSAQFLISNYQHSLVDLTLEIRRGARDITALLKGGEMHFPVLKSFVVREGTCHASLFFTIQMDALELVELRSMDTNHSRMTPRGETLETNSEEYWDTFFSQPALANIKSFHVQRIDPSVKAVMQSVALARGIDIGENVHPPAGLATGMTGGGVFLNEGGGGMAIGQQFPPMIEGEVPMFDDAEGGGDDDDI